jgi:hypothetical protein
VTAISQAELNEVLAGLEQWVSDEQRLHHAAVANGFYGRRDEGTVEAVREALAFGRDGWKAHTGLVSDPTSHKRIERDSAVPPQCASAKLRAELDAFELDPDSRRIAMLRRAVGFAARCHLVSSRGQSTDECVMVTLTYAGTNEAWDAGHIRAFMTHVREWYRRRDIPCRYVWVAELQQRGVIHYHAALWVPQGVRMPKPDECGWWPHGMTRIEVARCAVSYLMKYLSKCDDGRGRLPKGARSYGVGGLEAEARASARWLRYPAFIQARAAITDRWTRVKGGGWASPVGEWFASEFERVRVGVSWCLRRVCDHGRPFEAHGPFMWLREA